MSECAQAVSYAGTYETLNLNNRLAYQTAQKPWTTAEIKRLRYLWDDLGLTAGEIGKILGRSRGAVTGAARRHGMARRDCPIRTVYRPDLIKQRQIELARIAAVEELLRAA
jgi:hypothetical protein